MIMAITRSNGHRRDYKTYHALFTDQSGNTIGSAVVKATTRLSAVRKFNRIGALRHGYNKYELKRMRVV